MATATPFDIAKAGWLYRQSTVLHRWKRNWFVLDRQGDLRYFENPDEPKAEERIVVRACVTQIKTAPSCRRADPPDGVSGAKASFLELVMKDKDNMLLCAESFDDMRAWQIALDEARTFASGPGVRPGMQVVNTTQHVVAGPPGYVHYNSPYASYGTYPGQVISTTPYGGTTQLVHTAPGTTTVVNQPAQQIVYVDDDPYYYRRRRYGYGRTTFAPVFFW